MRKMLRRREYSFLTNSVERNADRSEFFRFTHPPFACVIRVESYFDRAQNFQKPYFFFPPLRQKANSKIKFSTSNPFTANGTLLSRKSYDIQNCICPFFESRPENQNLNVNFENRRRGSIRMDPLQRYAEKFPFKGLVNDVSNHHMLHSQICVIVNTW